MKKFALTITAAALLGFSSLGFADSTTNITAASGSSELGHLDITVTVPAILFLRVGAGGAVGAATDTTTVNLLTFAVPTTHIGDATTVSALVGDGDLGNGAVSVRVFSNVGTNVTLSSTVTGAIKDVAGDLIPWSQINVASAAYTPATTNYLETIAHPAFNTAVAGGASLTPTTLAAVSKIVQYEGSWTYTFLNTAAFPKGTYGGVNTDNGRVLYTALQL
jgi:hypothetical protein